MRDVDGELAIVPKLLHGRAALKLLEQAIVVFEGSVGKPRSEYDARKLEDVLGDYRLGRCIEACLLTRYGFVQPQLSSILSASELAALSRRGLTSPADMRSALWDAANERYGGFAPPNERSALLSGLAEKWGLPPDPHLVDALVNLDAEGAAVLIATDEPLSAPDLMRLYNRGAVQTLLAHSTGVQIDVSRLAGAALKRLYFVAKRQGVLVDIEEGRKGGYLLALYGAEQAFGAADKYGRRLADVTLSLLRSLSSSGDIEQVVGTALLLLHDRPYRFHLTQEVLELLQYAPEAKVEANGGKIAEVGATYSVGSAIENNVGEMPDEPSFDSLVEARLYKEYRSLHRQGYTHGWQMEREPDPLLAPGIVMIPDFAFLRGGTRVFMEIVGFWSPSYKERKLAKLRSLAAEPGEAKALILAVPQESASLFADLPFPVVPYKTGVRLTDLLSILDARYGQHEERAEAAQSRSTLLRQAAQAQGLVPEQEVAAALQAYTRTELLAAARSLDSEGCKYVAGVGLLSTDTLAKAVGAIDAALDSSGGRLPLEEAARIAANALSAASVDIEALLQLCPNRQIERPSLFEAYVVNA
ncbi:MAG: DUF790 family protein [Chloroflexi bacterium]|nr:DUF790 family protein [Chloroflexota bacterium]